MAALPEGEALLLAVYFEETAHYQAQQIRSQQNTSSAPGMDTYDTIGDDDAPELYEYPDDDEDE